MRPELTTGIIGAVVGALSAYLLGWHQKASDDRRKRKSIATALLYEVYPLTNALSQLRQGWPGKRIGVELPTIVLDRFPLDAELFDPETVRLVLDLLGSVRDVKRGMDILNNQNPGTPEAVKTGIQEVAGSCLGKAVLARRALLDEGGKLPSSLKWPTSDEVNSLLSDVKGYLKGGDQ